MKCCGHEMEDESNKNEGNRDSSNGRHHPGHSGGCCGGGGGIMRWLLIGLIVSLLILFIRGMV